MPVIRQNKILLVFFLLSLFAITIACSTMYGATRYTFSTIWETFVHFDSTIMEHLIIRTSRIPRVIGALLVGAFIAISGALMQGMTRNYLASPGIMGVTDGSVFVITLVMIFLPNHSPLALLIFSFIGSIAGATFVFALAKIIPGGMSPLSLVIIGTILGMFLNGVSQALATYFQISQNISFWYNTRLHQIDPVMIQWSVPLALIGLVLALYVSKSVTAISLGDEVAQGLGVNVSVMKVLTIVSVALLTGVSVALVGKVTFIGLVIPHITRFLVGEDYKKVIPYAGLFGALFFAWADVLSRAINPPFETPVGVITALVGVPYFLYLIQKKGDKQYA